MTQTSSLSDIVLAIIESKPGRHWDPDDVYKRVLEVNNVSRTAFSDTIWFLIDHHQIELTDKRKLQSIKERE